MANLTRETIASLNHEWQQMESTFSGFHNARDLDGTWKQLTQARLSPDIPPELMQFAQGMRFMSGMLADDLRILAGIHEMNPTRINAQVRGSNQTARDRESDYKLTAAGWWDKNINKARWLDRWVYQGQTGLGVTVPWLRWKKCIIGKDGNRPISDCPVYVEKTVLDAMRWLGDYRNPSVAWCKYTLSAIDCDIKNSKGERPGYDPLDNLGWVSEHLPEDYYTNNAGKEIEVIVRDAEDKVAMCPLDGCYHRKRRITIYICKKGGKVEDFEEVESYDSPFARCSFLIIGGDIQDTERNPHRIFRPTAWVLMELVDKYNLLMTELFIAHRREMSDDTKYGDLSSTNPEVYQAWNDREGGSDGTIQLPETGSREIKQLPFTVRSYGQPTVEHLKTLLGEIKNEYALRRPNPALTGQMALSEVSATGVAQQVAGAGVAIGPALANWDGDGIVRILEEIRHGIRFTGHFEPEDEQTKYAVTVSGHERVYGSRGGKSAGDEVFLDAKKCETPVDFYALTSKDTPAEQKERKIMALTGYEKRILTKDDLFEAWDVFDGEEQARRLFREDTRAFIAPLVERRMAMYLAKKSAIETGMDFGEEQLTANVLEEVEAGGPQTFHNTIPANLARTNPGVELAPTGTPSGGSSGLAGP